MVSSNGQCTTSRDLNSKSDNFGKGFDDKLEWFLQNTPLLLLHPWPLWSSQTERSVASVLRSKVAWRGDGGRQLRRGVKIWWSRQTRGERESWAKYLVRSEAPVTSNRVEQKRWIYRRLKWRDSLEMLGPHKEGSIFAIWGADWCSAGHVLNCTYFVWVRQSHEFNMKLYSYRLTSKMQFCDLLFVENLEIISKSPVSVVWRCLTSQQQTAYVTT